jgi:ATP-dependent DNA helicase RecG
LVTPKLTKLTEHQRKILFLCEVPRSQADLMKALGLSHRTFFRRTHLEPLIKANLVRMIHPDEPNHPSQAYVVTEAGLGLLSSWKKSAETGGNP